MSSVQLPTGDENDWLGTEPDIDEAATVSYTHLDVYKRQPCRWWNSC